MRLDRLSYALYTTLLVILVVTTLPSAHGFRRRYRSGLPDSHRMRWVRRLHQSSNPTQCAASWLGYQCTQLVCGRIRIHWSLGGEPPSSPNCSYARDGQDAGQVGAPDPQAQVLHIALQTDITGYVSASWPRTRGEMSPADAVIGSRGDGSPTVRAYGINGYSSAGITPDPGVNVTNTGLQANATALTVCFSRSLSQVGRAAAIRIRAAEEVIMNFVASVDPWPKQHRHSGHYQCSAALLLLSSPGGPDDGGWRPSNISGSGSGANQDAVEAERLRYMRAHGALEFTGWVVLVPLGVLAARHRWVFPTGGFAGLWFQVHRAVQMLAVVLVATGFALPWTTFDSEATLEAAGMHHDMEGDMLLETHERLAIMLVSALGLHLVVAVLRPKPDASWRWAWTQVHWWTGRGLAVLAGVNVAIGIALWRRVSGGSGAEWIVPLAIFAVAWLGLAVWLERRAPEGRGREGGSGSCDTVALTNGFSASSPGEVPLSRMVNALTGNGAQYTKLGS